MRGKRSVKELPIHGINMRRFFGNARHYYAPSMWIDVRRHIPVTRVRIDRLGIIYEIHKRFAGDVYGIHIAVPLWLMKNYGPQAWRWALAWELRNARRKMRATAGRSCETSSVPPLRS